MDKVIEPGRRFDLFMVAPQLHARVRYPKMKTYTFFSTLLSPFQKVRNQERLWDKAGFALSLEEWVGFSEKKAGRTL